mmetsp:Transcript_5796/g.13408  ORF Transcript_5796/g.13408 Transcript_5796/m.13408 type:complete len:292 (-) Transcript_5796:267-1142(-)|eukprot:CAMPEP_0172637070 /NCGR_PEP_ID=MMETSP1068-20121228/207090_1 /TAXON_ID=35684 /ORGANISM="Pseudopedinella elastica, Strain CCMP716" /LENGTH=291 /DNA_ID=CAMNT_0013449629 /DNA_START=129 /DNA_END=1001 /DNA_ORIENTATION=+
METTEEDTEGVISFGVDSFGGSPFIVVKAPSCWVELLLINSIGPSENVGSPSVGSQTSQYLHASETLYRELAVLRGQNTLGPLSPGKYELKLSECYGTVGEELLALKPVPSSFVFHFKNKSIDIEQTNGNELSDELSFALGPSDSTTTDNSNPTCMAVDRPFWSTNIDSRARRDAGLSADFQLRPDFVFAGLLLLGLLIFVVILAGAMFFCIRRFESHDDGQMRRGRRLSTRGGARQSRGPQQTQQTREPYESKETAKDMGDTSNLTGLLNQLNSSTGPADALDDGLGSFW